jgi:hypothetical protein
MMGPIQIVGITLGTLLIAAFVIWAIRGARRDEREVNAAWSEFVARHAGWRLNWADKPLWRLQPHDPAVYAMSGPIRGVPVEVELWARDKRWTVVRAPIVVPPGTPPGATISDDALDPGALARWQQFRSLRPRLEASVWPAVIPGPPPRRGEGYRVTVSWPGRERDPAALEAAIELVLALAARPPARFGPGPAVVPHYLRE